MIVVSGAGLDEAMMARLQALDVDTLLFRLSSAGREDLFRELDRHTETARRLSPG